MLSKRQSLIAAIVCFAIAVAGCIGLVNEVLAEDLILEGTVDSVTIAFDKNGNEYVRVIITETRTLQGVTYEAGTPVMFFGDLAEKGKALQKGDKFKAVADKRLWNGRLSYTVRVLLNE